MKEQGKLDEAVACYRRALELKPDYAEAHNNLGNALKDQGKLDEAVACYRRALELKPDYAEAHNNLGIALKDQGKLDEAVACYRRALELKPDYADAHLNLSLLSLLTGDFQRGWAEYQWRWKTKQCQQRDFPQPLWDGQPLEGRTILLHAEQGLGDTIQFIRYAPLVKQAGASVLVECQKPLVRLLAGCRGVDALIGRGDDLPPFDVQAPLLSLPGIFHTSLETIPADVPYLFADPGSIEHWRGGVGPDRRLQDRHCLAGAIQNTATTVPARSRCSCFESLAGLPGIRLLSLQKGRARSSCKRSRDHFPVTDLGSRLEDFMDTAAVLTNLDLVITCDTAVAHLAGALGVPVWVALPFVPDWRWLLDRSDSPWYPTMRLFRQRTAGEIGQACSDKIEAAIGRQHGQSEHRYYVMATISEALAIAIQHHQAGRLQAAEQIYRQILAGRAESSRCASSSRRDCSPSGQARGCRRVHWTGDRVERRMRLPSITTWGKRIVPCAGFPKRLPATAGHWN